MVQTARDTQHATLTAFLAVLLGVLALVVGFNVSWDASGLRTGAEVEALALRQARHQAVVWEDVFDQRAWVRARLRTCPTTLILGSSTVGRFESDHFPEGALLNAWLTGASLEDLEGVAQLLADGGCRGVRVVLGVDPWLFNARVVEKRWITLSAEYLRYHRHDGNWPLMARVPPLQWERVREPWSFAVTEAGLRTVLADGWSRSRPRLVDWDASICKTLSASAYARAWDGHYLRCPAWERTPEQARAAAQGYLMDNPHGMNGWMELDGERAARLHRVVDRLQQMGEHVILVEPPYHPVTLAALQQVPRVRGLLSAASQLLADWCAKGGAQCVLARDPATIACTEEEFSDGHHARSSCAAKLAAAIRNVAGRPAALAEPDHGR